MDSSWPTPKNIKEVQSILGFANFYRKFILHYSLTTPLTSLTRKGVKFSWSSEANKAFRALQKVFTSAPILQHFQPDLPLTIEADASDFALGCILSQPSLDCSLRPICFYSRKFTPAKLNYPIYDKELLVVVDAFKQWRVYVEGAVLPVSVYTDHKNLEYFSTARTTSRHHARWATSLSTYNFIIYYRKGTSNGKPDALSRRPDYIPPPLPSLPVLTPSLPLLHTPHLIGAGVLLLPDDSLLPDIRAAQAADADLSATMARLQGGPGGGSNPALPEGSPSGRSTDEHFRL